MENKTVNAERVAPPVLRYTDTYTLSVNGTDYTVTCITAIADNRRNVFTSVTFTVLGSVGTIEFPPVFAVTGGYDRETLITEYAISREELAGLIAGAIAYDSAYTAQWDSTH